MKRSGTYIHHFATEREAIIRCSIKNQACRRAGNYRDIYAVVDGPDNNFSVVDLKTAIELGGGYQIVD